MYIYNQEGRKEHIIVDQGKVIQALKVAILATHKTGTATAYYSTVTIKGIPKDHNVAHVTLLNAGKLNKTEIVTGVTVNDDAVMTVFDLVYSSVDYIGITINITDHVNKILKSIDECYIVWNNEVLLVSGTNNPTT